MQRNHPGEPPFQLSEGQGRIGLFKGYIVIDPFGRCDDDLGSEPKPWKITSKLI